MAESELNRMSAAELARRIRAREVSPVDAVEASLARIAEVNPALNAFCFVHGEEAMEEAREAERAVMEGRPLGPLHGVPYALKDMTPTKGRRTTMGSFVHEHWVPDFDAEIAVRLRRAGGILVGKTTTPEFAYMGFTESPLWGISRNPWDTARTPGGSSGGSGAAVAAGCVPIAEGSDMGGSVRIPASFCGTVGLKPSLGRIPFEVLPSVFDNLNHFGPIARTVEDAALFLSVVAGPDERDILTLPPYDVAVPPPADLSGMRLALDIDLGYRATEPGVAANTLAAARALAEAGAVVEEVDLGADESIDIAWHDHWCVWQAAFYGQHLAEWRDRMDPRLVAKMEKGLAMSAVDFKRTELVRTRFWHKVAAVLGRYDALLCPTTPLAAPPVEMAGRRMEYESGPGVRSIDNTSAFSCVAQCPAISIPSGLDSRGLPTGLQAIGRRYGDNAVLRIAAALEKVRPWEGPRPAI